MIIKLKILKQILKSRKHDYVKIERGGVEFTGRNKEEVKKVESLKPIFNRNISKIDITSKTEITKNDNVFVCWLQGIDNAPEIVKVCYEMLKKNSGNRKVILITNKNLSQYVEIPEFIMEKWRKGIITNTHFSDIIRTELLCKYGGFWVDATALVTSKRIFDKSEKYELAIPSCCDIYPVNSWFLYANKGDKILLLIKECLYDYWKINNELLDYFLWQMFALLAYEYYKKQYKKIYLISHYCSHFLGAHLMFQPYNKSDYKFLVKYCCDIHKLSYKFSMEQTALKGTYYETIIKRKIFNKF